MKLFNRKQDKTTIPELQEYYDNQRANRMGMAWLMALASLLITVGVLSGLFFGGRWVYRKIADRNDDKTAGQATTITATTQKGTSQNNDKKGDMATPSQPAPQSTPAPQAQPSAGQVSSQAASTSTPNTSRVAGTSTSTSLPNTGPTETLAIVLPIVVAFLGTVGASAYQSKRH
jgi:hypothetical protein